MYFVYVPRARHILVSSMKVGHREYILQSLLTTLGCAEARELELKGKDADSLLEMVLHQQSMGPFVAYRLGEHDSNPFDIHAKRQKTQEVPREERHRNASAALHGKTRPWAMLTGDGLHACLCACRTGRAGGGRGCGGGCFARSRDRGVVWSSRAAEVAKNRIQGGRDVVICTSAVPGRNPASHPPPSSLGLCAVAAPQLETRYRGGKYDIDGPFFCRVKFEGTSVIEGIRSLVPLGVASAPLPAHIADLHSTARSSYVLQEPDRNGASPG